MSPLLEKPPLLPNTAAPRPHKPSWASRLLAVVSVALVFGTLHLYSTRIRSGHTSRPQPHTGLKPVCPQEDSLTPSNHADLYKHLSSLVDTQAYTKRVVAWLSGAVRIPTESYDEMLPVGQDPRWDAFVPFHEYLREVFPRVHANLGLTKVNTYGLVYHWQGSDAGLKPLVLTAHQDVVPVDPKTVDQWVHPPYSGYFDGTYVWGRGSADDKSGLTSIMASIETLLENDFAPTRSIVLAFGFDEEISGLHGAQKISEYLLEHYGEDSAALLVDEGGGWSEIYGEVVAIPAIGEKGHIDVRVHVSTPGGHSSIPPPHTSIGILSQLLVAIEAHPQVPRLSRKQPTYGTLQCLAEHTPDMPKKLRKNLKRSATCDKALRRAEDYLFDHDPVMRATVGTTQAIDLISGGVKTNALPEEAAAIVNHRIATDSSVDAVQKRITKILKPLAHKFNLSLSAFGEDIVSGSKPHYGALTLSDPWGTALAPAPISPTDSAAFKVLSGTIKRSLLDSPLFRGTNRTVVVAPGITTGNTDTRFYWKLTRDIVRYSHYGTTTDIHPLGSIHTVNEAIKITGILRQIRFFTTLILNSDESTEM